MHAALLAAVAVLLADGRWRCAVTPCALLQRNATARRDASMDTAAGDTSGAALRESQQEDDDLGPGLRTEPPSASTPLVAPGAPDAATMTVALPAAERAICKHAMVAHMMDKPLKDRRTHILKKNQWLMYKGVYLRTSDHSLNCTRRFELAPDNTPTLCVANAHARAFLAGRNPDTRHLPGRIGRKRCSCWRCLGRRAT